MVNNKEGSKIRIHIYLIIQQVYNIIEIEGLEEMRYFRIKVESQNNKQFDRNSTILLKVKELEELIMMAKKWKVKCMI